MAQATGNTAAPTAAQLWPAMAPAALQVAQVALATGTAHAQHPYAHVALAVRREVPKRGKGIAVPTTAALVQYVREQVREYPQASSYQLREVAYYLHCMAFAAPTWRVAYTIATTAAGQQATA
jgi:hypothetical protein